MKPIVLATVSAVTWASGLAASPVELTESQALRILRDSPYLKELRADIELVRAKARVGTFYPDPTVSATFEGAGRTDFYMVEQPLAINGRLSLLRQAAESSIDAANSRSDSASRRIEADVRQAFHQLLWAQERDQSMGRSVRELEELVRILRELESAGQGSRLDLLRAEQEIVELKAARAEAKAGIAKWRATLGGLIGPAVQAEHVVARGSLEPAYPLPDLQEAIAQGLAARGDYRVESDRLRELELRAKAADRWRIPNPVVSAGLKRADLDAGFVTGPVLAVSVGLPLSKKARLGRKLVEAEALRVRSRRDVVEHLIRAEIRGAHAAVRIRRRLADEYDQRSGSRADEIRRITEVAYREGELGILDLLQAYRATYLANLRLLDLRASAKFAEVEFDRTVAKDLLP